MFEGEETFSVRLILDSTGTDLSSSVVITKDLAVVTILANDGKHSEIG